MCYHPTCLNASSLLLQGELVWQCYRYALVFCCDTDCPFACCALYLYVIRYLHLPRVQNRDKTQMVSIFDSFPFGQQTSCKMPQLRQKRILWKEKVIFIHQKSHPLGWLFYHLNYRYASFRSARYICLTANSI